MQIDQEQMQQDEHDNDAAFAAGFAGVAGGADASEAPAQVQPAAEAKGGAQQPASGAQPAADAVPEQQPNADDQPRIAGLTEAEVRTLLGRVPELEQSLRKVNGKLGEYGSVIQELRKAPAQPALTPERIQEIEAANPDLAAYINARMPVSEQPASEAVPQFQELPSQPDLQSVLMDHFHEGWNEKVKSQDFLQWLAVQPEDLRNTFYTTELAKELSAVISKFDAWGAAKQQQQAKSSARLQNSLTPTGTPGKAKTALSDNDAFEAGFRSVRGL